MEADQLLITCLVEGLTWFNCSTTMIGCYFLLTFQIWVALDRESWSLDRCKTMSRQFGAVFSLFDFLIEKYVNTWGDRKPGVGWSQGPLYTGIMVFYEGKTRQLGISDGRVPRQNYLISVERKYRCVLRLSKVKTGKSVHYC